MSRILSSSLMCLSLWACGSETTLVRQTQVDTFEQAPNDEVDILFVVDDSNSMAEEQVALAEGFIGFIAQLQRANSRFQLGVISTSTDLDDGNAGRLLGTPAVLDVRDDYVTGFRQRVQVGTQGSDKEKGLYAAELALSPDMLAGPNQGFLRPEANLLVAFVTDEEDCSDGGLLDGQESAACYDRREDLVPVEHFHRAFVEAKGGNEELVRVGAIIGPRGEYRCETAWPGERYARLAAMTDGLIGDICAGDWSDMLVELGLTAVGVRTTFDLTYPAVPGTIVVTVDGVEVLESATDGYTYEGYEHQIQFHGAAVPPRSSIIVVEYEMLSGV